MTDEFCDPRLYRDLSIADLACVASTVRRVQVARRKYYARWFDGWCETHKLPRDENALRVFLDHAVAEFKSGPYRSRAKAIADCCEAYGIDASTLPEPRPADKTREPRTCRGSR
jgi:hypothetical protein